MAARSPTILTLRDTRFVECRWWNDGWSVVTCRSSASVIPAPGHRGLRKHLESLGLSDSGHCDSEERTLEHISRVSDQNGGSQA